MTDNKTLITEYLRALSGKAKPAELVRRYVSDPALARHIEESEAAFPSYEILVEDMIGEGDRVAVRGTFQGVQRGSFAGISATGRSVRAGLIIIYRIENGRIVEHWMQLDTPTLLAQLQGTSAGVSA